MDYLHYLLGINLEYENSVMTPMPNFIYSHYNLRKVSLDGIKVIFLYPKMELDSIYVLKKHINKIQENEKQTVVLVTDRLTYRQRECLIKYRIPFIVEGKQVYLPFMGIFLKEKCDAERLVAEKVLPSSQVLLLYYIYNSYRELLTSELSRELRFTPTSIHRASMQLEDMGLLKTRRKGIQKVVFSEKTPEDLFCIARKHLLNPVKRTIYVSKSALKVECLMSSYFALSQYSMLNPPIIPYVACANISGLETRSYRSLQDEEDECAVELWRYDPKRLSKGRSVDKLSLALALQDDHDERVEEAVKEMLSYEWKCIYAKRN